MVCGEAKPPLVSVSEIQSIHNIKFGVLRNREGESPTTL